MSDNAWIPDPSNGAQLLDDVESFLSRFVVYPSESAKVSHVLWIAHTWVMDVWESTPRIAILSPEPGSGKSRALEVTEPLVPRPVHAVNVSPSYLFRKVSDPDGAPTILYDEIDTVFGPRAKDNEDVRGMLNAGHRRGATAGRCVIKGKTVSTEELPAYCAVALAGLDDMPDTLMTRSVIIRMRRRAPGESVEPWRLRVNGPDADALSERLMAWGNENRHRLGVTWPEMPAGIEDRNADVWEALLAIADHVGEDWPERARVAAVTLVTQASARAPTLGVTLLRDLRTVFDQLSEDKIATDTLLEHLIEIDESPWGDLRGKDLDARGLARRLGKYGIKPKVIRTAAGVIRGYERADLHDAWSRYLQLIPPTENLEIDRGKGAAAERLPAAGAVTSVTALQPPPPVDYDFQAALRDIPVVGTCGRCQQPHTELVGRDKRNRQVCTDCLGLAS